MKRTITHYLYIAALAATLCPVAAPAAELVKLKPVATEVIDDKGANLKNPEGIACSRKGAVMVADTGNGRLLRYAFEGDTLKPGPEIKLSQLPYPTRVRISSRDETLVLDGKLHRIARVGVDGNFIGYVDPVEALMPKSFALDSRDNIYILDVRRAMVIIADPDGKKLNELPFPADARFISDITIDIKGNILLLDSVKRMVYVAQREAKEFKPLTQPLREYLDYASDMVSDSTGRVYLIDQNGGAVIILGPDGSFQGRQLTNGRKAGLLHFPAQACITEGGDFFVADRNNSRVQIFKIIK